MANNEETVHEYFTKNDVEGLLSIIDNQIADMKQETGHDESQFVIYIPWVFQRDIVKHASNKFTTMMEAGFVELHDYKGVRVCTSPDIDIHVAHKDFRVEVRKLGIKLMPADVDLPDGVIPINQQSQS